MNSTIITFLRRVTILALVAAVAGAATVGAAEFRTWTNTKGKKIEAKLSRIDGEMVVLTLRNGRTAEIKREVLSQADLDFLAEYGGEGAVARDLTADALVPEKSVRIDTKQFKEWDEPFQFEGLELEFDTLETPHFLILTSGSVRPGDLAECAEALWHGMSFQHPSFFRKWKGRKMAVMLVTEGSDYDAIGAWHANNLRKGGNPTGANDTALSWPQAAAGVIELDAEVAAKYDIMTYTRCFRVEDASLFEDEWSPFPTHCLSGDLLNIQMGGVNNFASAGYFALSTGHKYYKEIHLCGETQTRLVNADAYASDEVVSSGGFEDGRDWARTLKDVMRKEKVKPSIAKLYRLRLDGLTPTDCVLTYAFSRYLQSTVGRLQSYAKLAERVETSNAIPAPIELAKIYGFDSVKAMEDDWIAYMDSNDFR